MTTPAGNGASGNGQAQQVPDGATAQSGPIHGLDRVQAAPAATVLWFFDPACADAVYAQLPEFACIAYGKPGCSFTAIAHAWTAIAGRRVLLWMDDAEDTGVMCCAHGCAVSLIALAPGERPADWNARAAIAEGLTGDALRDWINQHLQHLCGFAGNQFEGAATEPATTEDTDWRKQLLYRRHECVACLFNIKTIMTHAPEWVGLLAFDEFAAMTEKKRAPPWPGGATGEWQDTDDVNTAMWLTRHFGMTPSGKMVTEVVETVARANSYHPVRDWLRALPPWDGTSRLGDWLSDWVGIDKTEYTQLVGRYFLIGMVARVMGPRPGDRVIASGKRRDLVKFDYCLVLEGPQARFKSTALAILGGDWFGDTDLDLHNKDAMSALRGKWLYEFSELGSISRAETSRHKSFLSRTMDEFRPAFGRREIRLPRQCVFGGTVNDWEWNNDPTGGRRFWPVNCLHEIDIDGLQAARPQLFAEALAEYTSGARFWPTGDEQARIFDPEQLKIERHESLIDALHDWVFAQLRAFPLADAVTDGLSLDASKLTRDMQTRVGVALRKLGCRRVERRNGMIRYWYEPPEKSTASSEASLEDDSRVPF